MSYSRPVTLQTLAAFMATLSKPQAGMLVGPHREQQLHHKQVWCFVAVALWSTDRQAFGLMLSPADFCSALNLQQGYHKSMLVTQARYAATVLLLP